MASLRLQEGNLFIHATNPVFAALPFDRVTLRDPAFEFALHKLGRHVGDEPPLKYVSEQFENTGRSSHRFLPFS